MTWLTNRGYILCLAFTISWMSGRSTLAQETTPSASEGKSDELPVQTLRRLKRALVVLRFNADFRNPEYGLRKLAFNKAAQDVPGIVVHKDQSRTLIVISSESLLASGNPNDISVSIRSDGAETLLAQAKAISRYGKFGVISVVGVNGKLPDPVDFTHRPSIRDGMAIYAIGFFRRNPRQDPLTTRLIARGQIASVSLGNDGAISGFDVRLEQSPETPNCGLLTDADGVPLAAQFGSSFVYLRPGGVRQLLEPRIVTVSPKVQLVNGRAYRIMVEVIVDDVLNRAETIVARIIPSSRFDTKPRADDGRPDQLPVDALRIEMKKMPAARTGPPPSPYRPSSSSTAAAAQVWVGSVPVSEFSNEGPIARFHLQVGVKERQKDPVYRGPQSRHLLVGRLDEAEKLLASNARLRQEVMSHIAITLLPRILLDGSGYLVTSSASRVDFSPEGMPQWLQRNAPKPQVSIVDLKGDQREKGDAKITSLKLPALREGDRIVGMDWDREHEHLFLLHERGVLRKVTFGDLRQIAQLDLGTQCNGFSLSSEGIAVAAHGDESVWLIDELTLQVKGRTPIPGCADVACSKSRPVAYVLGEGTFSVVDLKSHSIVHQIHRFGPRSSSYSRGAPDITQTPNLIATADGRYLLSQNGRYRIEGFELVYEQPLLRAQSTSRDGRVFLSPDGKLLAATVSDVRGHYGPVISLTAEPHFPIALLPRKTTTFGFDRSHVYAAGATNMLSRLRIDGQLVDQYDVGTHAEKLLPHPAGERVVVLGGEALHVLNLPKTPPVPGILHLGADEKTWLAEYAPKPAISSDATSLRKRQRGYTGMTSDELDVPAEDVVLPVPFSSDGSNFYLLSKSGLLRCIGSDTLRERRRLELQVACSSIGRTAEGLVVLLHRLPYLLVIDAQTLEIKRRVQLAGASRLSCAAESSVGFAWHSDPAQLFLIDFRVNGKIQRIDATTPILGLDGKPSRYRFPSQIRSVKMTPDGRYVFIGGFGVTRFEVSEGALVYRDAFSGGSNLGAICVSPDSKLVASIYGGGERDLPFNYGIAVRPVDDPSSRAFSIHCGAYPRWIAFDPAGQLVYTQDSRHQLVLFNRKGERLAEYELTPRDSGRASQFVHPQGNRLLIHADKGCYWVKIDAAHFARDLKPDTPLPLTKGGSPDSIKPYSGPQLVRANVEPKVQFAAGLKSACQGISERVFFVRPDEVYAAENHWNLETGVGRSGESSRVISPDGRMSAFFRASRVYLQPSSDEQPDQLFLASGARLSQLEFSPGSDVLLVRLVSSSTGTQSGTVQAWDTRTRKLRFKLQLKQDAAVQFLPDGKSMLLGPTSTSREIAILSLETGAKTGAIDIADAGVSAISDFAISADGLSLAAVAHERASIRSQFHVLRWNLKDRRLLWKSELMESGFPARVRFSRTADYLVAGYPKRLKLLDGKSGKTLDLLDRHLDAAFLAEGNRLAIATAQSKGLEVWDLDKNQREVLFEESVNKKLESVSSSWDGRYLVTLADGGSATRDDLHIWDVETGRLAAATGADASYLSRSGRRAQLAFTPNGRFLLAASDDGVLYAWDMQSAETMGLFRTVEEQASCLDVSSDGRFWLTAHNSYVYLWEAGTGHVLRKIRADKYGIRHAQFVDADKKVLTAGSEGPKLWDVETGESVPESTRSGGHTQIAYDATNHRLATHGGSPNLTIIDANNFDTKLSKPLGRTQVRKLAFSPDASMLAVKTGEKSIRVLSAETLEDKYEINEAAYHSTFAFSPKGDWMAVGKEAGRDIKVAICSTADGKVLKDIPAAALTLAIAPDGKSLATMDRKGAITVWNVETGEATRSMSLDRRLVPVSR